MKVKLTDEQVKHLDTVRWLVSDGYRGEGRTTVLAVAYLEKAMSNEGKPIAVVDHHLDGQSTKFNLMPLIGFLFSCTDATKIYKMELRKASDTILFRKMTPTELKEKGK